MEHCQSLADGVAVWRSDVARLRQRLTETQQEINEIAFGLYGITGSDRQMIEDSLDYGHFQILSENSAVGEETGDEEIGPESEQEDKGYIVELLSYSLGCLLGRWDIRFPTDERQPPQLADPFAPLPVCSPGMLTNVNGLPAAPDDVPGDYPLRISWPGILVDDEGHPEDIIGRVREIFELIWQECASEIEHETCDLLGVQSLRDYFTRPNNFFAEHLKRYSKSRRKAPIYWPLQTPSGSYTLWLYYHRLHDQTLYTCVNDFVEPKLRQVAEQLNTLRSKTGHSNQENKELERLLNFEQELKDFRDELLRVAWFWKPNLNDGAQITAAPLWKLFQHKPWQKTLKETWDRLEHGDYDWAHLAYSIWPDRVREKCKHDRSLAIAHGLEYWYEEPPAQAKKKRGRK
jgi:hypothetical protein